MSKVKKCLELPRLTVYQFLLIYQIFSFGALGNFATNATKFYEKYPGIRSKICTLSLHFYCPIFRELILAWGMLSANANSIKKILLESNDKYASCNSDGFTSNAVAIVVGGAQEALNSSPGVYKLVLKKRKGFIKIALKTGASLVPVICFGEVDIYDQKPNPPDSVLRKIQVWVCYYFKFKHIEFLSEI